MDVAINNLTNTSKLPEVNVKTYQLCSHIVKEAILRALKLRMITIDPQIKAKFNKSTKKLAELLNKEKKQTIQDFGLTSTAITD